MRRWPERQRAMLREMGIGPFWPETPLDAEAAPPASTATRGPSPPPAAVPGASPLEAAASSPAGPPQLQPVRPPATPARLDSLVMPALVEARRPEGVERMDWATLQSTVAVCRACGLCESRRQTVFGVGHAQARWMIVGEAPGEQEDRQGEPFVGRAGMLLDRMLDAVGLTRASADAERQVFIANVLKCRPPGNRNPLPEEVAQCEPYLMRQIDLVQPRIILALGRFAAQSLLKSTEPIGRLRGRVHEVRGVPVIVSYHPAYLLRNPIDKALVWDDLCRARALMKA